MARTTPERPPSKFVLIGSGGTIAAAADALSHAPAPVKIVGAVLLGPEEGGLPPSVKALGTIDDLGALHARHGFDGALVSIPGAMSEVASRVASTLSRLGVAERVLAPIGDVLAGGAGRGPGWAAGPPPVDMLALVGRTPHPIDAAALRRSLEGKRVLVTGAGGSIGAELARLAASFGPSLLCLMDRSDNALFEIDRQIGARYPEVARQALLHDVVETEPTLRRLVALRPDVVFHAAAHKHVPMMEDHPAQAVNNNLFGAKSIADASLAVGVERFVMISTDKAVNPTSVMGATKRFAEMYVRSLNSRGLTRFCMVRFGNVLGSACSVLPIWSRQIAEGGPVTVTDERMTRYFMTIPEAAALVAQAAALDPCETGDAEVFVLDMGEPVRIAELADRFVRAHGLLPRRAGAAPAGRGPAIEVVCTGARPGEKLHEELVHQASELRPTPAPGVLAWTGPAADPRQITEMIAELSAVRTVSDDKLVLEAVSRWAPTVKKRGIHPSILPVVAGAA